MIDYTTFDVGDFVRDDRFCRWVLREPPAETTFWTEWLRHNPTKADTLKQAKQIVLQLQQAQESLTDEELREELGRLTQVREQQGSVIPLVVRPWHAQRWLQVAAVLAIVLGGSFAYLQLQQQAPAESAYDRRVREQALPLTEVRNDDQQDRQVRLPDGSQVRLHSGSRISFSSDLTSPRREVYLSGEAFFEVTKNPRRPFLVYANELTTKVLGTSFTVKASANDNNVAVLVKTGRVSVFPSTDASGLKPGLTLTSTGLLLTPNQQAVFNRAQQKLERGLVSTPEPVVKIPEQSPLFVFNHTPVRTVFKRLEETYGISIVYDAEKLAHCELSAELSNEPLFRKLDLICSAIDSRYEVVDAQIVIYSNGCE